MKQSKPVRFKDIPVGSTFSGVFGGSKSTAKKLSETRCLVKKVTPQGRDVILTINPELNEDEFILLPFQQDTSNGT